MPASQKTFFLGGAGVVALGLLIFFAGKFFAAPPVGPSITSPAPAVGRDLVPKAAPAPGPTARVVSDQEDLVPSVRYSGSSFVPRAVTIGEKDGNELCAVRIENRSPEALTVRLGPPRTKDDHGFPYPTIPAGESILIDPRYHVSLASFYSREHPMIAFEVRMEGECR